MDSDSHESRFCRWSFLEIKEWQLKRDIWEYVGEGNPKAGSHECQLKAVRFKRFGVSVHTYSWSEYIPPHINI